MTFYRYLTRSRSGKWYRTLAEAQQQANSIGAGFTDLHGAFVAYRGSVLEVSEDLPQIEWARRKDQ